MLPDLGGLAGQHCGAHVLAAVQLLYCSHHHMHRVKQQRRGELQQEEEEVEEVEEEEFRWREDERVCVFICVCV